MCFCQKCWFCIFPVSPSQNIHVPIENTLRMYHLLSAAGGNENACVMYEIMKWCTFLEYHMEMYKYHVFDDFGEISIGI